MSSITALGGVEIVGKSMNALKRRTRLAATVALMLGLVLLIVVLWTVGGRDPHHHSPARCIPHTLDVCTP